MVSTILLAVAGSPAVGAPAPRLSRACGDMSEFSAAAFRTPDSFFAPSTMWIWNDALSEDRLREQLRDLAAHGLRGAMPLAEPKEFRPTFMPTRLEPEYLGPEFMNLIRAVVAEGERLGMRIWLYDEGGWPSGSVCGRLVRENPRFARSVLQHVRTTIAPGGTLPVPAEALAAWLSEEGGEPRRLAAGAVARAGAVPAWLDVYSAPAGGSYPDLLCPEAVDTFIRMTHDLYAQAVGDRFGSTIPMIFTDEPQASATPWTDGLPADFLRTYGYDLLERLPAVFDPRTDDDRRVRIDYYDWWSRRFADVYLGRIQEWCHRHGLLSTGHLNGEDETMGAVKYGFGNLMRCMRRLDIPGIDVIWRQIWPGQPNSDFPKQASSVAHQEGRRWAMSESFAVYGSGLTLEQMKWVTDYQLVRGITHIDIVGSPYSTADWLAGGERPHFDATDPQWRWLPCYCAYAARVGYALSVGRSGARTALYFPLRDLWAGGPEAERAAAGFERLCRALLERQCDADLLDDDVLGRSATRAAGGALTVGELRYSTVVVPPCRWMPPASRAKLAELARGGGRVLAIDPLPDAPLPDGAARADLTALDTRLDRCLLTARPEPWLRALTRETASARILLITNEDTVPRSCRVTIPAAARPVRLDPLTGQVQRIEGVLEATEGWELDLDLPFAGSVLLICPRRTLRTAAGPGVPGQVLKTLDGPWTLRPEAAAELTGTEVRWAKSADAPPVAVQLGEWAPALGEAFSGHAVYETEFACSAAEARRAAWLDLGSIKYAASVELNGKALGDLCWTPWTIPLHGALRRGANRLRVTVGNTLANQYLKTTALNRWKPNELGPYHPRALCFEPDSLAAGLFGPVTLRAPLGCGPMGAS